MSTIMHKDIGFKGYIKALAEAETNPTDFDLVQASGRALREEIDRCENIHDLLLKITKHDDCVFLDRLASHLISESSESAEDLLAELKKMIVDHYKRMIIELVEDERFLINLDNKLTDKKNSDDFDKQCKDAASN